MLPKHLLGLTAGVLSGVLFGAAFGLGVYTFVYAKGYSYLTNDPQACANCHVMEDHFAGWIKSPHHGVAACNDCHTPHNLVGKYTTKALNGFWHSFAFTTGEFPEPLRIKQRNHEVTEERCRDCHADMVAAMVGPHAGPQALSCIRCHEEVGHPQ